MYVSSYLVCWGEMYNFALSGLFYVYMHWYFIISRNSNRQNSLRNSWSSYRLQDIFFNQEHRQGSILLTEGFQLTVVDFLGIPGVFLMFIFRVLWHSWYLHSGFWDVLESNVLNSLGILCVWGYDMLLMNEYHNLNFPGIGKHSLSNVSTLLPLSFHFKK